MMKNEQNLFDKLENAQRLEQSLNAEMVDTIHKIKDLRMKIYCARLNRKSLGKKFDFIKNYKAANEVELIVKLFPELESSRQIQIANEMTKLKTEKEIANACHLSVKTIKWHKTIIYSNLNIHTEKQFLAEFQTRKALSESKNGNN